jgi:tRNA(fMet)-specific endonuclease VapC
MSSYCFDTDVLSAVIGGDPPLDLVRRLAEVPPHEQSTTAITLGELVYGATKRGSRRLAERIRTLVIELVPILPFDRVAAETYGRIRGELESAGRPLGEPDLRIASIALSRGLILVTGNLRHFSRISELAVEDWLRGRGG